MLVSTFGDHATYDPYPCGLGLVYVCVSKLTLTRTVVVRACIV
jgi:hypothetical protein